ncbi:hypothetical protein M9H77_08497 [Catharanthus roseus]|uniref:Uncharacterized protein n=1 Tax=Catharanthus roseus TaxID=4058 RepID=A0ACC0BY62_CATRO|nr:hypothetical protein M9H77_08497 [Catharanthus roseus]
MLCWSFEKKKLKLSEQKWCLLAMNASRDFMMNLRQMSDDLHTSTILNAALQEALRYMNSSLNTLKKQKQQLLSAIWSLTDLEREIKQVLDIFGLLSSKTYSEVLLQLKDKALKRAGLTEEDVSCSTEDRTQARKNEEFLRSDQIRADLVAKGIVPMDVGKETIWRPCVPIQQEKPALLLLFKMKNQMSQLNKESLLLFPLFKMTNQVLQLNKKSLLHLLDKFLLLKQPIKSSRLLPVRVNHR